MARVKLTSRPVSHSSNRSLSNIPHQNYEANLIADAEKRVKRAIAEAKKERKVNNGPKGKLRNVVQLEDLPETVTFQGIRDKIIFQYPLSDDELVLLDVHKERLEEISSVKALNQLWRDRYGHMTLDEKKSLLGFRDLE